MSPFLRIGFSQFEIDPGLAYHEEVLNPYCAVYMKEAIDTGQLSETLTPVLLSMHQSADNSANGRLLVVWSECGHGTLCIGDSIICGLLLTDKLDLNQFCD